MPERREIGQTGLGLSARPMRRCVRTGLLLFA
jgi:hypothetical protein